MSHSQPLSRRHSGLRNFVAGRLLPYLRNGNRHRVVPCVEGLEQRIALASIAWDVTNAPNGGDWDTASNWVGGVVPGPSDFVTINLTKAGNVVTHSGSTTASIYSLTTGSAANVKFIAGTLNIGFGGATIAGPLLINSGASMNLAAATVLAIAANNTVTDNGTFSLGAGATVSLGYSYGATTQLVVGGTLNIGNGTILGTVANNTSQLVVNAGARVTSAGATFNLTAVNLVDGANIAAGDMTGSAFDTSLYVGASALANLANNARFRDINIAASTLTSGQTLALNAIGTSSTVNLSYAFPGGFTIGQGASVTVAPNVRVTIPAGQTLTNNGSLTFGANDVVTFGYAYGGTTRLVVGGTGTLTAGTTTFNATTTNNTAQLYVSAGGRLISTGSNYGLTSLYLDQGATVNSGDFTGNVVDTPMTVEWSAVSLLSNNVRFQDINILNATLPAGTTLNLNKIGTSTAVNLRYVFPAGFTIAPTASVTVAAGVPLLLAAGQTFSVGGTLTLAAGDSFNFGYAYGGTTRLVVTSTGTLNATWTNFVGTVANNTSQVYATAGGHIVSTNSTYALTNLYLENGTVIGGTDFTGNFVDSPLYIGAGAIPAIANNSRFQDINILGTTLTSGQTLALNAIGTSTTASLRYLFPAGLTINPGASLTVAAGLPVVLGSGQTLAVNGSASFGSNDTLTIAYAYGATTRVAVGSTGTLTLTGTSVVGTVANNTSQVYVGPGGRLISNDSSFAITNLYIDNGAILNNGDFTGNFVDSPLYIGAAAVPTISNNSRFQDINILSGTLGTGQTLALNAIGTTTTALLRYLFPGGFTVASGATLNVAANLPLLLGAGQTLNVTGTMNLSAGDAVTLQYAYGGTTRIVVSGVLNAPSSTFAAATAANNTTQLYVASGGRLISTGSIYTLTNVYLDSGSIVGSTDFVGNGFDSPLYVEAASVSKLANNLRFQDIDILAGTLFGGSTLALSRIGTANTTNLRYVFPSGFTVASGATVDIDPNLKVLLGAGQTFTDAGVVNVGAGDLLTFDYQYGATTSLVVTGQLNIASATLAATATNNTAQIVVNSGGTLSASYVTSGLTNIAVNSGGTASLSAFVPTIGQIALNSAATLSIAGNDFSNLGANAVQALGDPLANIDLRNNYWGTSSTSQIQAKIKDHATDATRPTVLFQPFVGNRSTTTSTSASVVYSPNAQVVNLSASVTSPAGTVNEGTETFTILYGANVVGSPITVNVVNGTATTPFTLPGYSPAGAYTIKAVYNGTANFVGAVDTGHVIVVNAATSTTTGVSASTTYSGANSQYVNLGATVASSAGTINEGSVTFSVFSGTTLIGTTASVSVVNGAASAAYVIPAGTAAGNYSITAAYIGGSNFLASSDASKTLTIAKASSATAAAAASGTFAATATQTIALNATVTSAAGTVNGGTETFTIKNGSTVIGTPITVNVINGAASGGYPLPAGLAAGTYTIEAVYNGSVNFLATTDSTHLLTINAAASSTSASSTSAGYQSGTQKITVSALVVSGGVNINEGTETFTLYSGTTVIGTSITVNVVNGAASGLYSLPAGLAGGTYVIQAVYNGTTNYLSFTESSHVVVVNASSVTNVAASASATFVSVGQSVSLSASVTSSVGIVNEGTETFTILSGTTVIGTSITVNVINGVAAGSYVLPAGLAGGSYIVKAVYNGTSNFLSFTDTSRTLIVAAAATVTVEASASATFIASTTQSVSLSATVTSVAGVVNEGTETFTILSGATVIGTSITVNVINGVATGNYLLPAGLAAGSYTIKSVFNGTASFATITDTTQVLTIGKATTVTAAASVSAVFVVSSQTVTLTASVTSVAGTVNSGTETFTIYSGTTVIGTSVTVNVVNGVATASYLLPANLVAGTYTVEAVFAGTSNLLSVTDRGRTLVISQATSTTVAVSTSTSFSLSSQSVNVSASVTSTAGIVSEGTETFTILSGTTVIGTSVTVNVVNGVASANYVLPANLAVGNYILRAVFNGSTDFLSYTDTTRTFTITKAQVTTFATTDASIVFSSLSTQTVLLSATVTSTAGIVASGTETFTILSGSTIIGTSVTVNVVNGVATGSYVIPSGLAVGIYTIQSVFNPNETFYGNTDATHHFSVTAASTVTVSADASSTYVFGSTTTVSLSASITSAAAISINEGVVTFAILSGTTVVGTTITAPVNAGSATANYVLPAGTPAGNYVVRATFGSALDFASSVATNGTLVIGKATPVVSWSNPADIVYGTSLTSTQLAAIYLFNDPSHGDFTYDHPYGSVLGGGAGQILKVTTLATSNYVSITVTVVINVLPATPVITWNGSVDLPYGTALGSAQYAATASFAGSPVAGTFSPGTPVGTVLHAGKSQILTQTFTPDDLVDFKPVTVTSSVNINPKPLTVTVAPSSRVYGQANPTFSAQFSGFVNQDGPGVLGGTLSYQTTANVDSHPGNYDVTASGLSSSDYAISYVVGTLAVGKAAQTVSWSAPADIVYGAPLTAAMRNATATGAGSAPAGALTYDFNAGQILHAGTYALHATAAETRDYLPASASVSIKVRKAALQITANDAARLTNQPDPKFTVSYGGFVNGDGPSNLAAAPTVTSSATPGGGPGTYSLIPSGAASDDYDISYRNGTLTVNPAFVTILSVTTPTITTTVGKKKVSTQVVQIKFSDALDAASTANLAAFKLLQSASSAKGKPTPYAFKLNYDSSTFTVTLTPTKALSFKTPVLLQIASGMLKDRRGNAIDGNHDGAAGGDFSATLRSTGVSIQSVRSATLRPAAVDAVLAGTH